MQSARGARPERTSPCPGRCSASPRGDAVRRLRRRGVTTTKHTKDDGNTQPLHVMPFLRHPGFVGCERQRNERIPFAKIVERLRRPGVGVELPSRPEERARNPRAPPSTSDDHRSQCSPARRSPGHPRGQHASRISKPSRRLPRRDGPRGPRGPGAESAHRHGADRAARSQPLHHHLRGQARLRQPWPGPPSPPARRDSPGRDGRALARCRRPHWRVPRSPGGRGPPGQPPLARASQGLWRRTENPPVRSRAEPNRELVRIDEASHRDQHSCPRRLAHTPSSRIPPELPCASAPTSRVHAASFAAHPGSSARNVASHTRSRSAS